MRLRDLEGEYTSHPMPWLQWEAGRGAAHASDLLDQEVSDKFVFNGGLLIFVSKTGKWMEVARIFYNSKKLEILDKDLWRQAKRWEVVSSPHDPFTIPDWGVEGFKLRCDRLLRSIENFFYSLS